MGAYKDYVNKYANPERVKQNWYNAGKYFLFAAALMTAGYCNNVKPRLDAQKKKEMYDQHLRLNPVIVYPNRNNEIKPIRKKDRSIEDTF
jgi:hypothetical protein